MITFGSAALGDTINKDEIKLQLSGPQSAESCAQEQQEDESTGQHDASSQEPRRGYRPAEAMRGRNGFSLEPSLTMLFTDFRSTSWETTRDCHLGHCVGLTFF